MWRNLSSWMARRQSTIETEQDSGWFPWRGRSLGSGANQGASIVNSGSSLQTRVLDDGNNQGQVPDLPTREGVQQILDGRPTRINSALAPIRTANNQIQIHNNNASEEEIQKLVAMGFDRTQVEVAIAAADRDLHVAVEILMSQQG